MRRTTDPRAASFKAGAQTHWSLVAKPSRQALFSEYHHHYADDEGYACVSGRRTWHGMNLSRFPEFVNPLVFDGGSDDRRPKSLPVERLTDSPDRIFSGGSEFSIDTEVRTYCLNQELSEELHEILKLASDNFRFLGQPSVTVEVDPEDGDTYILVYASVFGSVDDVFILNDRYIEQAVARFGSSVLSRIRLLYKLATSAQDMP